MWAKESVIYQIYPLGFCDTPKENDGILVPRLEKVLDYIDYLAELGVTAVLFNPLFESDCHGYDTRDYKKIDVRLGDNELFSKICKRLHKSKIKVILDGVFHHVGRGFFAFLDLLEKREASRYKDWFYVDFHRDNGYGDGIWYEGWEGHFELVKLNLSNPDVVEYLFACVKQWIDEFEIDGLRLDVAYCLDKEFLKKLRIFCKNQKEDFYLIGEMLFGDYKTIANETMLDSVTNYECYKGLYSSFNDRNLFEIAHSLNRQFSSDPYALYQGKHFISFVDNHDVTRVASILKEEKNLPLIYALMFVMNGIPCIYYGSEWGAKGRKENGDQELRKSYEAPIKNELWLFIKELIHQYKKHKELSYGTYKPLFIANEQLIIQREFHEKITVLAMNINENEVQLKVESKEGTMFDTMTHQEVSLEQPIIVGGHAVVILSNYKP